MTAIFKIKGKDLTPQFLKDLQEKYADRDLEIKVTASKESNLMVEVGFWNIIALLNWSESGNDELVLKPAIKNLATQPVHFIYQFQDFLSEKLFALDGKSYAQHIGEDAFQEGKYFSPDNFLYARCCVVANGQETFYRVLENPSEMPKDVTFEPLLRLASKAYQLKTGKTFNYFPSYNYETYSNEKGWNN